VLSLSLLCAIVVSSHAGAQPAVRPQPAPARQLKVVTEPGTGTTRLTLVDGSTTLASLAVPAGVSMARLESAVTTALWHDGSGSAAVTVPGEGRTFIAAFVSVSGKRVVAVDISEIEGRNIGGIGPHREYARRESAPVEWLEWSPEPGTPATRLDLRVRTRVWDSSGRRYTGTDVLRFAADGTPLWR
jgi:hypothetical protein